MRKQLIVIGIIVIFIIIGLSGCNEKSIKPKSEADKDKFIGTWTKDSTDSFLTLASDGTYTSSSTSGTWSIKDGKLVLDFIYKGQNSTTPFNYTFSNDYKTLTLTTIETNIKTILYKQ